MEEKILTLHPQGKKGVNILKRRYDQIAAAILNKVETNGTISFSDLGDQLVEELADKFDGKVLWYVVTVKLDLEARGILERVPKTSPHQLRISTAAG